MSDRFHETVDRYWGQFFEVSRTVHRQRSAFQDIQILENRLWGRVLVLDGVVQTTEADEHRYHEALVHVPLTSLAAPRRVLIVGGGDGGTLREVLKHPVERVVMVEIDGAVIDACRTHMPALSAGAFDDDRVDLIVGDGIAHVATSDETFDAILVDSTDPGDGDDGEAPGGVLFTDAFYADAARRLSADGILAAQHAVPFLDGPIHRAKARRLAGAFALSGRYEVPVPTYTGGPLGLGWGSAATDPGAVPAATLASRLAARGLDGALRFYSPARHHALFALSADDGIDPPARD
ncbi:spermidine synthase [Rhodothalassium salexigens]|uniref:polyamine aminopropyltransferase n=1 Tax=Rhodothalassium salexigens TaxID=1086 RepID=UPI0019116DCF|nr:spermidine synthase [Rhodothalassium salexigens]